VSATGTLLVPFVASAPDAAGPRRDAWRVDDLFSHRQIDRVLGSSALRSAAMCR
jgi:hypothetical protein